MEPITTEATCASAITPACLMKSAAKITNPSAPPVRLLCPQPCRERVERLNAPHSSQKASVSHLDLCLCATENSCKGRCGEAFRRGRRCSCDPDCQKFKQCCSDFQTYCDATGEFRLFFQERSAGSVHGFRLSLKENPGSRVHVGSPAVICTQMKLSLFPVLVITSEEISGAPSATEPVKSNSCHHVNHNAPKGIFDLMLIPSPSSLILGETTCFSFVSNMLVSPQQRELQKMDQGRLHPSMEETIQVMTSVGINAFQNVHWDFAKSTIPLQSKLPVLAALMFEFYLTQPQMVS